MPNSLLEKGKKALTAVVTATTILWSVGAAGLPLVAKAAVPPAGSLIKASLPSVYFLASDGKRYVFPNEKTYFTWYSDFSGVVTISDAELANIAIGGNVVYRAGTRLVKITTDPKVYVVQPNGMLSYIPSEAAALTMFGSDWNKQIDDVSDAFFTNYKVGAAIDLSNPVYEGMLFRTSVGGQVYLFWGGKARPVSTSGMVANRLWDKNVRLRTDLSVAASMLALGTPLTGLESVLVDTSQGGGAPSTPSTPVGTGTLTVSLASDTPAGVTLASGTAFNKVLKVHLTSSGGVVKISGLKVRRIGISADTSVDGVSVWDASNVRHGNIITFADNVATFTFQAGEEVVVDGSADIYVALNIAAAVTGGTVGAQITSAADIISNAVSVSATSVQASGVFPIQGNIFTMTSGAASVGSVMVDAVQYFNNGAGDATATNISIGDNDKDLTKFRFTAGANEDLDIWGITATFTGNASNTDWAMPKLYAPDGTLLSTGVLSANGQYVTWNLATPYRILKGQNRDLSVRISIPLTSRGSNRTIRLVIQNNYDVMVKGVATGAFLLATTNGSGVDQAFPIGDMNTVAAVFINKLTIQSGTATLNKSVSSPTGNISAGGNTVLLADFSFLATGEDMEVRQIAYAIAQSGGATNLTGTLRFEADGSTIYSVSGAGANYGAITTFTPNTFYLMKAGQVVHIKVYGDISQSAAQGQNYTVSFDVTSVRRTQTNDITDPLVPVTAANTLTVQAAQLTVSLSSAFSSTNVTAGSVGVKVGSFTLSAGSTEPVSVSSLSVGLTNCQTGCLATTAPVSNLRLMIGSNQFGTAVSNPGAANTFSGQAEVAQGSTLTIDVYLDIPSAATGSEITSLTVNTAIGKNSGVTITATGSPATGQTMTFGVSGSLTIALDTTTTPTSHIIHSNQIDEPIAAVRFSADNFENITISKVHFSGNNFTNNYQQFKLFDGSTQLAAVNVGASAVDLVNNTVDFGGLSITVAKAGSKVLVLKGTSTNSGVMVPGASGHASVAYVEANGASSGAQIKPGTTLATTWTATNATVAGAAITVGNSDGFNVGDVAFIQDTTNGGSLGVITGVPSSSTVNFGANTAIAASGTAALSKIASGATTAASAGTVLRAGAAVTVTSTVGFTAGDVVLAYNTTDGAILGMVSAIGSSTSMTIRSANNGSAATSRVSKIGLANNMTSWTAGSVTVTGATAQTVASTAGFNIGDLVLVQDTTNGAVLGMVTAIGSSTSLTVIGSAGLALGGTGSIARIGGNQSALVTTAATAGNAATALTATTVTSTVGFGAGDVVGSVDATNGFKLGRVGAVASSTSLTIGSNVASAVARTRVTRALGAAASARLMVVHNVEPVITVQASSPNGAQTGQLGQKVAAISIKADGDRDLTYTSLNVKESGSNNPQVNASKNAELKRGSTSLAKVQDGTFSGTTSTAIFDSTTIEFCTGAPGAKNRIGNLTTALWQKVNHVGAGMTILDVTTPVRSQVVTVSAVAGAALALPACGTGTTTLTFNAIPSQTAVGAVTVEPLDRFFDASQTSSGDTALAPQVITGGTTDNLDILWDTDSIRTGAGAGTSVSFGLQIPGVQGLGISSQPGGLVWNYTDPNGVASGSLNVSDSYPVNSNTLVY